MAERTYCCIDMKTFFASVECAERNYNPFETNLVVADETRGKNAICLAITPKMKAAGIKNRCRLSEIPPNIVYEIAPPQMQVYIDYAADIYDIYLDYFSPDDIHVYSIDEAFIDLTDYLKMYKKDAKSLVKEIIGEIEKRKHIPATAGIGSNLYLAKIALDITAKHVEDHMGMLTEAEFIKTLWTHRPITDFWGISTGTANRLARYGIYDQKGIANANQDLLYKVFGINAELLIDHAWGRETCLISDIKKYKSKSKSVSFSQILPRDYNYQEARTVLEEMVFNGVYELLKRKVVTSRVGMFIGYSLDEIPPTGGTTKISAVTNLASIIMPYFEGLYDTTTNRSNLIRRIGIEFLDVEPETSEEYDLFTDVEKLEKEKNIEKTVLEIKSKYGKNSLLKGINLQEEATQRERNTLIGGHRAGYDKGTKS